MYAGKWGEIAREGSYRERWVDYELIDDEIYMKIKYGTSDKSKIVMIKSGMSLALVNLIASSYSKFVSVDSKSEVVSVSSKIETEMMQNDENIVLLNEVRFHVSK